MEIENTFWFARLLVKQYLISSVKDFFPCMYGKTETNNLSATAEKLKKLERRFTDPSSSMFLVNELFLRAMGEIDSFALWSSIEENVILECSNLADRFIRTNAADPPLMLNDEWQVNLAQAFLLGKVLPLPLFYI